VTRAAVALPPDLDERTLVREMTHRVNNQLASAIDVVTAAAVRAEHPEARVALGNVADLLPEQANVHRVLTIPVGDALVDAAQYLRQLCLATTRSRLEPIGVHLSFQADTLPLEPERCWRLGMAVHELLTNSARQCVLRRPSWRDQDQVVAERPGGQLHHCGQWFALRAVEAGAGPRHRSRFDREPGRSARIWLWPRILIVSFGVYAHRTRAAGQQGSRFAPHEDAASTEDDQFAQADHDTTAPECRRHSVEPAWAYSGIKRAGKSPPLRGGPNDRRGGRPRAVARKTRI
jgi:hypothetical protein